MSFGAGKRPSTASPGAPAASPVEPDKTEKQGLLEPAAPRRASVAPNPVQSVQYRFLTPGEWARLARGLGAVADDESRTLVRPTCWYWPPRGLPRGIYRKVVTKKTQYRYHYALLSNVRWVFLITQIVLGAALTSLGSLPQRDSIAITVIAAINTVIAGVMALMHNSGLPERFWSNHVEFAGVEDYYRELLDMGIVQVGLAADEVLASCFDRYQAAQAAVEANLPANYTSSSSLTPRRTPTRASTVTGAAPGAPGP